MNPTLVSAIVWSAAGLAVGFVVGYIVRGVVARRAPQAVVDRPGAAAAPSRSRASRADWAQTIAGILILGLVGFSVYQSYSAASAQRDFAQCEIVANRDFQNALAQRSSASKAANDAQRKFLAAISLPGASASQRASAEATYIDALNAQDQAQTANPLTVRDCGSG